MVLDLELICIHISNRNKDQCPDRELEEEDYFLLTLAYTNQNVNHIMIKFTNIYTIKDFTLRSWKLIMIKIVSIIDKLMTVKLFLMELIPY